jgi:hypothetical protein
MFTKAQTQRSLSKQIRATTVGELQPLEGPILLVEYDPDWPRLFRREDGRLREPYAHTQGGGREARVEYVQNHAGAKTAVIGEIIARAVRLPRVESWRR